MCNTCPILAARNEELEAEVANLRSLLFDAPVDIAPEIGLTSHERAILLALLAHERVVSREVLYEATRQAPHAKGESTDPVVVSVRMCTMRAKLKPFGIEIETVWGRGYRLPEASRQALLNWNTEARAA